MQQVIQTPEQQQFLVKLLGFDYTIEYKSGITNKVAHALSIQDEPPELINGSTAFHLLTQMIDLLEDIKRETSQHPKMTQLHDNIVTTPDKYPHHSEKNGIIYYK